MEHLNDYSDAHDWQYEAACKRDEAVDRMVDVVIADKAAFVDAINGMIERDEVSPAELIAMLYASRAPIKPEWFSVDLLEYATRNVESGINDTLKAASIEEYDNRGGK